MSGFVLNNIKQRDVIMLFNAISIRSIIFNVRSIHKTGRFLYFASILNEHYSILALYYMALY